MVNVVSIIFPLDLMMKSMHFQVKKRLSFELQKVAVGLSTYPPLSAASEHLAQRRIWMSIDIIGARYVRNQCAKRNRCLQPGYARHWRSAQFHLLALSAKVALSTTLRIRVQCPGHRIP